MQSIGYALATPNTDVKFEYNQWHDEQKELTTLLSARGVFLAKFFENVVIANRIVLVKIKYLVKQLICI